MATVPPAPPTPPPPPTATPVHAHKGRGEEKELTVVSHSTLFYWWPVWAFGFLFGTLTWFDGHSMLIVPSNTLTFQEEKSKITHVAVPEKSKVIPPGSAEKVSLLEPNQEPRTIEGQEVILLPEGKAWPEQHDHLRIARSSGYGVIWATVLLLVIFITNVPLRGILSVFVIIFLVLISIIFALAGWWDIIINYLTLMDIRINAGGYFFVSGVLFGLWLFTLVLFDRQVYMVFSPGQLRVCMQIGGGEDVYSNTDQMSLKKQRSDLFRHWILGLGSGDLIIDRPGKEGRALELDNVLFIGRKAAIIERLMKTRKVDTK